MPQSPVELSVPRPKEDPRGEWDHYARYDLWQMNAANYDKTRHTSSKSIASRASSPLKNTTPQPP
jgi:hypothetical protein